MTSSFRTGRRILTAVVIVAFLMPLGPAIFSTGGHHGGHHDDDDHGGGGGGFHLPPDFLEKVRNLIKCIISCIDLTLDCRRGCTPQCQALFPNDSNAFGSCWVSCQESCTAQRKNCVAVCKFEFTGETPELP